jgi:hypothetical protein
MNIAIVPPLGVYAVAGCGVDLLINIMLTILGYVAAPLRHSSTCPVYLQSWDREKRKMDDRHRMISGYE